MSVALDPALIAAMEKDVAPLRLAIYLADLPPDRQECLGISSITRSLMNRLARRDDLLITQVTSRSSLQDVEHHQVQNKQLPFRTDASFGRALADTIHPWLLRTNVDLWYYPNGYAPRLTHSSAPSVGTLHGTIAQHDVDHEFGLRSQRAFKYDVQRLKQSLSRHCCVMTVSQHAAGQLAKFCERHRIDTPPIEVTYQGSDWEANRGHTFAKCDYVLHLASSQPDQRTDWLLKTWQQLPHADLPQLKLVGQVDAQGQDIVESLTGISLIPHVNQEQLRELIGGARMLLLPGESDAFGAAALAAYYVHTPVCYARGTAIAEIVQDAHQYGAFDPADIQSFRTAVDQLMGLSESQIRTVSDAMYEMFSTERVCDRVVRVMRQCIGKTRC